MEPHQTSRHDQPGERAGHSTTTHATDEDDSLGFWALMFWEFDGLDEKETGRFIGDVLAARYDGTAHDLMPVLDDLLAQLEAAEQNARGRRQPTRVRRGA